jgi:hypothetical protein
MRIIFTFSTFFNLPHMEYEGTLCTNFLQLQENARLSCNKLIFGSLTFLDQHHLLGAGITTKLPRKSGKYIFNSRFYHFPRVLEGVGYKMTRGNCNGI